MNTFTIKFTNGEETFQKCNDYIKQNDEYLFLNKEDGYLLVVLAVPIFNVLWIRKS